MDSKQYQRHVVQAARGQSSEAIGLLLSCCLPVISATTLAVTLLLACCLVCAAVQWTTKP